MKLIKGWDYDNPPPDEADTCTGNFNHSYNPITQETEITWVSHQRTQRDNEGSDGWVSVWRCPTCGSVAES